ncbi:MAG: chemotaxis response regulator protein-glutamate methylesterase [Terriglobales bacterium]|jgi:two-component system chemotaxis response regulator CheB
MVPIRILVVDDSIVIRRLLSDTLSEDPALEVVATAGDGRIALAKIALVNPDLVTLDIEMPVMDGLETLIEIRKLHPRLPVIMFSTLTERGAAATLDALALGASDYATKPSNTGSAEVAVERIRTELVGKIKALSGAGPLKFLPLPGFHPTVKARLLANPRIEIVAIGTSTGGPNALSLVIPQLPLDFPVPVVVVQHMPPLFTRLLAERLNVLARLQVGEGKDGEKLQRGQVWIAPGDEHMTVARRGTEFVLGINHDAQENSCRPAVDVLFRSVAEAYGANSLAVVLTGMGADGTRGASEIRAAGGEVIVQDEASSVVWGMPGSVVAASLADRIYPLGGIAPEVVRRVAMRRSFASGSRP